MRVVFMGTPGFAVPPLEALAREHDVVAVYTRPDAASGRGRTMQPTQTKRAAIELGLNVRMPATLRDPAEVEALAALAPDVGVVAAYGLILPPEVLAVPRLGFLNIHASLLPRWRGAAPIQRAILAGDTVTGVSIMRMEEGLDTGPYCVQAKLEIDAESAETLTAELSRLGTESLLAALARLDSGECVWVPQSDAQATYAEKVSKTDVRLDPALTAEELARRVRASSRQAPARAVIAGTSLTVMDARPKAGRTPAGVARRSGSSIFLGTADGDLELVRVKPEGRTEMDVAAWLRGVHVADETQWSGPA